MPKYRVTFQPMGKTVEADPAAYPYGDHGLPGSLLDIALAFGVPIEHACGGVGACATCHVIVTAGEENLSPPSEEELDQVELAPESSPDSRLACLAVVRGDVTVRIPGWNRNAVSENASP
ncbi:MAG: 2Fe-2S iron-sulfur cluster binding domain-containing protein [Phycisphaerae bacterium]|nr:2Fe-2S iron-sulfur cluster binding domain-containing protein [Phycisphaerae bacterium]